MVKAKSSECRKAHKAESLGPWFESKQAHS